MIIKHRRFLDVAVETSKPLLRLPNGNIVVRGVWINQGFVESFPMGIAAKFKIRAADKKDWQVCNTPLDKCIRHSTWRPLE